MVVGGFVVFVGVVLVDLSWCNGCHCCVVCSVDEDVVVVVVVVVAIDVRHGHSWFRV